MKHRKPRFHDFGSRRVAPATASTPSRSDHRIDQIRLVRDRMQLTSQRLQRLEHDADASSSRDAGNLKSHYRRKLESDRRLLTTLESFRQNS